MSLVDPLKYYAGLNAINDTPALQNWCASVLAAVQQLLDPVKHGDLPEWLAGLAALPKHHGASLQIAAAIKIENIQFHTAVKNLAKLFQTFSPWRKGPYIIDNILIDSEWRSDLKWQRLKPHIQSLHGRLVLDVGCGNGYHCWHMHAAGARTVLGIEPMLLYVMQYLVIQHFVESRNVFVLPFTLENLPTDLACFDTVFSMGVLYHQRAPLDHLFQLQRCLKPGGELVLETLVLPESAGDILTPLARYAGMRNVWFIPSLTTLTSWLQRCGFQQIRCVDVSITTVYEQRVTDWSSKKSLQDFLEPNNPGRTIEGYPAPQRAIILASR